MFRLDLSSIHSQSIIYPDYGDRDARQLFMLSPRIIALLFSLVRRRGGYRRRGRPISFAERRRLINRKRRWFTDNIIMHHRRLHEKNREIAVNLTYKRILEKQKDKKPILSKQNVSWCQRIDIKSRANLIKQKSRARQRRAISRWGSIIEERNLKNLL